MKKLSGYLVLAMSAAGVAIEPVFAADLRCGSALVSEKDPATEVWDKCGPPRSRSQQGYHEVVDDYGGVHQLLVEEWVYGPTNGMYQILRFEGNRLIRIDSHR